MEITKLTLDWDYYQHFRINEMKKNVIDNINKIAKKITILEGEKGLNIILELKKEIDFQNHIFWRVALFDDPFRIQNDMMKKYNKDVERINRVWLWKNNISKKVIFDYAKISEKQFDEILKVLEQKKKQKKEVEK